VLPVLARHADGRVVLLRPAREIGIMVADRDAVDLRRRIGSREALCRR
jgi:hypothetical protein